MSSVGISGPLVRYKNGIDLLIILTIMSNYGSVTLKMTLALKRLTGLFETSHFSCPESELQIDLIVFL